MLSLNHIHLKSQDPRKAAAWYVEMFGAEIVRETDTGGATTLGLDVAGVRLNISSPPPGEALSLGSADPHLGLEHYAIQSDDLEALLAVLEPKGLELLEPFRVADSGAKIAFVRAPDDVRIELIQPAT